VQKNKDKAIIAQNIPSAGASTIGHGSSKKRAPTNLQDLFVANRDGSPQRAPSLDPTKFLSPRSDHFRSRSMSHGMADVVSGRASDAGTTLHGFVVSLELTKIDRDQPSSVKALRFPASATTSCACGKEEK